MKHSRHAPAVTSLPQAPQAEANARVRRYAITMTIRMVCFALMVLVTPYDWYTWVFGIGAAVLPYIAVVFANAGSDSRQITTAESPTQAIEPAVESEASPQQPPQVLRIQESRKDEEK